MDNNIEIMPIVKNIDHFYKWVKWSILCQYRKRRGDTIYGITQTWECERIKLYMG